MHCRLILMLIKSIKYTKSILVEHQKNPKNQKTQKRREVQKVVF